MTQVIRVDLDKLREQARKLAVSASLHQQNWHPMLDNRALFPDHEGSQIGSKHPRADDQVGRLGAGLTDIVMYNKMVVTIDIVMLFIMSCHIMLLMCSNIDEIYIYSL